MSKEIKQYSLNKNDLKRLEALGELGFPIELCGSKLESKIPSKDFMELYLESDEAQICYESGKASYTFNILNRLNKQSEEGQFKATEYLSTNIATLKVPTSASKRDSKASTTATQAEESFKVREIAPHLFDPMLENDMLRLASELPPEPVVKKKK